MFKNTLQAYNIKLAADLAKNEAARVMYKGMAKQMTILGIKNVGIGSGKVAYFELARLYKLFTAWLSGAQESAGAVVDGE